MVNLLTGKLGLSRNHKYLVLPRWTALSVDGNRAKCAEDRLLVAMKELEEVVLAMKNEKAPDRDGIPAGIY